MNHSRRSFWFVCFFLCASTGFAETPKYPLTSLPLDWIVSQNPVEREKSIRLQVENQKDCTIHYTIAWTIFNKEQQEHGRLTMYYMTDFEKLESLEGTLYDASGKQVKELTSADIEDELAYQPSYSLFQNERVRSAELFNDVYPYTVEFTYTLHRHGYFSWPPWYAQSSRYPVEHSELQIILSRDTSLRYWCNTDTLRPTVSQDGSKKQYQWEATMLPYRNPDEVADIEDVTPIVLPAPTSFQLGEYKGTMTSWKEFGQWSSLLWNNRDVLPDTVCSAVQRLLLPTDNDLTKITKVYRYMQSRTRYVNVGHGIEGWQPAEALFVHEHGYGDCKALVNYTKALLKAAGISSYPVLDNAGDQDEFPVIPSFPENHFDHVILCIPVQRDTVWLECTDNHSPANVLGTFTDGRDGLLINGEQSKLVHTPTRSAEENLQVRTSLLRFLNTDISAEVKTTYTGFQADDLRLRFVEASSKDQQQWILSQWKMPSATLQDFSLKGLSTYDTVITMTLKGTVQYYANISQNRLFFQPILLDRRTTIPTAIKHRYSPIRYSYPYHDIDTMVYILPAQYALEAAPGDTVISSSFGNYSLTIRHRDSDTLVVVRNIRIRTKTIPKERYEEYRKFYSDIAKLEKTKVILHWKL